MGRSLTDPVIHALPHPWLPVQWSRTPAGEGFRGVRAFLVMKANEPRFQDLIHLGRARVSAAELEMVLKLLQQLGIMVDGRFRGID